MVDDISDLLETDSSVDEYKLQGAKNKYKFWIIFISIFFIGMAVITGIVAYAWINSPMILTIKVGLDDDSLVMMNSTLELAESFDGNTNIIEKYINEIGEILDEI